MGSKLNKDQLDTSLVDTSTSQALTNKNLTGAGNTFPTFNQNTTGTASNVTGVVAAANGGTGQGSYAIGDIPYASTTSAISKLADIATGNALISGGVGVAPSYGKIGLTTHVTGTLPVANGGTGVTSSTGTGAVVLGTSPTLTTPALGTPSALVATNATGTAASLTAGTATVANGLKTATTTVVVSAATAPTNGQVLTASSTTAAAWVTPSGGGTAAPFLQTNDAGAMQDFASADQVTYYSIALAMVSGTINKLYAFVGTNTSVSATTAELGIYSNANSLLGSATATVGAGVTGLVTVTLGTGIAVTTGTLYKMALLSRTSTGDQVRYMWGANNSNNTQITGFTTGNATMASTLTSPSVTGRNYWVAASA